MKTCNKCGENKEYSSFYRNKNTRDGHLALCKDCFNKLYSQRKEKPTGYPRMRKYPLNLLKEAIAMKKDGFSYRVIEAELGLPYRIIINYVSGRSSLKEVQNHGNT